MKNSLLFLLALFVTGSVWAQDPKYREPEPRRGNGQGNARVTDDSNAAASRISSMELLDDTIPLRLGDRVSLRVVEDRDKTLSLLVQDSGEIQAPHLGLVHAAGLTCKKVAFQMKRELEKQYFQQATVIVALEQGVRNINGPNLHQDSDFFTVFGQVAKQGKYEMLPDEELTVAQAILRAGGPTQFAKLSKVKVLRKTPNKGNVPIIINVKEIMENGRLEKDIPIRKDDVIIIPEKIFNF
ncbi:MAG: polysaccharide biosynthesis/export family protein [Deltaproteobacteria bacterium]